MGSYESSKGEKMCRAKKKKGKSVTKKKKKHPEGKSTDGL